MMVALQEGFRGGKKNAPRRTRILRGAVLWRVPLSKTRAGKPSSGADSLIGPPATQPALFVKALLRSPPQHAGICCAEGGSGPLRGVNVNAVSGDGPTGGRSSSKNLLLELVSSGVRGSLALRIADEFSDP